MATVADQRHLIAKASITDIAAEVENDWRESARKLSQTKTCQLKQF
jgi:hypothetical protein